MFPREGREDRGAMTRNMAPQGLRPERKIAGVLQACQFGGAAQEWLELRSSHLRGSRNEATHTRA